MLHEERPGGLSLGLVPFLGSNKKMITFCFGGESDEYWGRVFGGKKKKKKGGMK